MTPEPGSASEALQIALEREVIHWPNVHSRTMFGLPAYLVGGKIFALQVPQGVVITRLTEQEREEISAQFPGSHPFTGHGQPIPSWIEVPVKQPHDLIPLLPYLRKSYEQAL